MAHDANRDRPLHRGARRPPTTPGRAFPAGRGIVAHFSDRGGIMRGMGGRVPARTMTDEAAALYLAFPGQLPRTSLASQLPENARPCCRLLTARRALRRGR